MKYTIKTKNESGEEEVKTFGSKKDANSYCDLINSISEHLEVQIMVEGRGDVQQTETFIKRVGLQFTFRF